MEQIIAANIGPGIIIAILMLKEVLPYIANKRNGHDNDTMVNGRDLIEIKTIVTDMKEDVSETRADVKRINGGVQGLMTWKDEHEKRHDRDEREV